MESLISEEQMNVTDFLSLHEYIDSYACRPIKDVLVHLQTKGMLKINQIENYEKNTCAEIDYKSFKLLMRHYIEVDVPDSLLRCVFKVVLSSSSKSRTKSESGDNKEKAKNLKRNSKMSMKHETLTDFVKRLQRLSKAVLAIPTSPKCSTDGNSVSFSHHTNKEEKEEQNDDDDDDVVVGSPFDEETEKINVKELVCCLSLLENGAPEEKLEFVFKIYDADGNGFLDSKELEHIVEQMMTLAENLEWDVETLKPILEKMIFSMDTNSDGKVSLNEWKQAGLTTVPLLALLGMGMNEDGSHKFRIKHFSRPTYCNRCTRLLVGLRKQGLCCIYCKYTVHEQCAELEILKGCITTFTSKASQLEDLNRHHWVVGNFPLKCSQCNKPVNTLMGLTGIHCRWCQRTVHDNCFSSVISECDFGELQEHILRPSSLFSSEATCALDLQIKPTPDVTPLLVLINQKSGGKQGMKIMRVFQYLLNPRQVFDLGNGGPGPGLKFFKTSGISFKILCCGGDGTVGWLLEEMDKLHFTSTTPVAILPLGTGNDLARCLGWGGGYEGEDLKEILSLIEKSKTVKMDRWFIDIKRTLMNNYDKKEIEEEEGDKIPNNIMNNYFSIGVDASIALRFHNLREKHPEKFSSRTRNKLWYFECGTIETLRSSCKNMHEKIEIECDGVPLNISNGMSLECIAILNIASVYGGSNLWGLENSVKQDRTSKNLYVVTKRPEDLKEEELAVAEQDIGDGLLEVVGLENCIHLAQVKSGIQNGKRLCQCSTITIRTTQRFPMQIDGEPWIQLPCQITISHHNQAAMLMSTMNSSA